MFKRFHQAGQPPIAPVLADAQLAAIRARIVSIGREMHLPDEKTELLVKAVAAQLAPKG